MKKQICITITLFFLICILTGCNKNNEHIINVDSNYGIDNFNSNDFHSLMTVVGESIICKKFDENGNIIYLKVNALNGVTEKIGTINNHVLSNNSIVYFDNELYFFVTTTNDNINMINKFYKLNINNNILEEIYSEENMQTFNYLALGDNLIYSTKGMKIGNNGGKTYIESYDPANGDREIIINFDVDYANKNGQVITNIDVNNGKIYATIDAYENENVVHYLNIYSLSGKLEKSINMSGFEIFKTAISDIKVIDDYIFILNMSNQSIIGIIENEEFKITLENNDLVLAQDSVKDTDNCVFYKRNSNNIYIFDKNEGRLLEKDISKNEEYTISFISKNNNNLLVYYISKEDPQISSVSFQNIDDII